MRYETPVHLANERQAIDAYANARGLVAFKLPERYWCDYALHESYGFVQEYVEVKCRDIAPDQYPTINIGLMKCLRCLEIAEGSGAKFVLLYGFNDGSLRKRVVTRADMGGPVKIWGRKVERSDQEREPCVLLDSREFVPIDCAK